MEKKASPRVFRNDAKLPSNQSQYLRAIAEQGDDDALGIILQYSRSTNRNLRNAAAMELKNFHNDKARETLETLVGDHESRVQLSALGSLEKVGDPRSMQVVLPILSQTNRHLIPIAVRLVTKWNTQEAVPALCKILNTGDQPSRFTVATFLLQMKIDDRSVVIRPLLQALEDPAREVRSAAASTLGEMREPSAVPKLIELAKAGEQKTDWLDPRIAAAVSLAKIRNDEALDALEKLFSDEQIRSAVCSICDKPDAAMADWLWRQYQKVQDKSRDRSVLNSIASTGTATIAAKLREYLKTCVPMEKSSIRETIAMIESRSQK